MFDKIKYKKIETRQEINELILKFKNGETEAGDRLVEGFIPLINSISNKFINANNKYMTAEIESAAMLGFLKAIKTFNINAANVFSTYFSTVIKNEIRMIFRKENKHNANLSLDNMCEKKDFNDNSEFYLSAKDVITISENRSEFKYNILNKEILKKIIKHTPKILNKFFKSVASKQIIKVYLKNLINDKHVSQDIIAEECGVSRTHVSRTIGKYKEVILKLFGNEYDLQSTNKQNAIENMLYRIEKLKLLEPKELTLIAILNTYSQIDDNTSLMIFEKFVNQIKQYNIAHIGSIAEYCYVSNENASSVIKKFCNVLENELEKLGIKIIYSLETAISGIDQELAITEADSEFEIALKRTYVQANSIKLLIAYKRYREQLAKNGYIDIYAYLSNNHIKPHQINSLNAILDEELAKFGLIDFYRLKSEPTKQENIII